MEPVPHIVVAAAIIEKDGQFLLTKRFDMTHLGGFWEFPGGKQEPGESLPECLKRELWEELRIEVSISSLFTIVRHSYQEKNVELHFFCCSLVKGNPRPIGCAELAWVPRDRLHTYTLPPADDVVLKKILSAEY